MGSYRDLQDRAASELDRMRLPRGTHELTLAAEFVAARFPELTDDPDAILAVLRCRERGWPASMVPDVRDQLAAGRVV